MTPTARDFWRDPYLAAQYVDQDSEARRAYNWWLREYDRRATEERRTAPTDQVQTHRDAWTACRSVCDEHREGIRAQIQRRAQDIQGGDAA